MEMRELSDLLTAIAAVLSAVLWPVVVLLLFSWLGPQMKQLLERDNVAVDGPAGIRIAASGPPAHAAISEAEELLSEAKEESHLGPASERVVSDVASDPRISVTADSQILWVDDYPENNRRVRQAFEVLGIRVSLALTTPEALVMLSERAFDLVISDLGRKVDGIEDDPEAGMKLLVSMRERGIRTPFILFAGLRGLERRDAVIANGGEEATNDPEVLFRTTMRVLLSR